MNSSSAIRRAAALVLLGACAAPARPPISPASSASLASLIGPPVAGAGGSGAESDDQLCDPNGAVELWGPWLEDLSTDGFRVRLAEARGLAAEGDLEGVLELLDTACAELAPEPAVHAARAGVLVEMGFPRAAELELERALTLAPDDGRLWWELGTVRNRLGLVTKADEALQQARALAKR